MILSVTLGGFPALASGQVLQGVLFGVAATDTLTMTGSILVLTAVVATGRLDGDTLYIDADGIMAKCPSKYEERPAVAGDYVSGTGSASN